MYAKTLSFPRQPFTRVGATTRAGLLSSPLRDRFGMVYHMEYYSDDELTSVVTRSAGILGVKSDLEGAAEIARRSRGTPRVANRLLRRVRDFAQVEADGDINLDIAPAVPPTESLYGRDSCHVVRPRRWPCGCGPELLVSVSWSGVTAK